MAAQSTDAQKAACVDLAVGDYDNAMQILQSVNHAALARKVPAPATAHKVQRGVGGIMKAHKSPRTTRMAGGATQEVDAPMLDKRTAARAALDAHDALVAAHELEPARDSDGMPLNPHAWLQWKNEICDPAYGKWSAAMDVLATALGKPGISRHPFNFRPICEEILRNDT